MGLFGFKKKEKQVVIPEPDKSELDWFFTEEAKELFEKSVRLYEDEMWETWSKGQREMIGPILEKGNWHRREYPCTFFADYLRALKTLDSPRLAVNAVDLALDGEIPAIPYPDCLKPEFNPLINFAIKIKHIYHSKRYDEDLDFNRGMECVIAYLHSAFLNGVDESNEPWLYEKSFWFDEKGKLKEDYSIVIGLKIKGNKNFLDFLK